MGADRVDIADAIIAGMAGGDDDLERLACIVKSLDEAGYVIVPKEPTMAMVMVGHEWCRRDASYSAESATRCYLAMIGAAQSA